MEKSLTKVKKVTNPCDSCKKPAETRILTLEYPHMPREMLVITECSHCQTRERSIFEDSQNIGAKVTITCKIDTLPDIQRYVYLNQDASIKFYDENNVLFYEYQVFSGHVSVLELIITNAIIKLEGMYGLKALDRTTDEIQSEEMSMLSENDKENAKEKILFFEKQKKEPNMTIVINDKSGMSRVGPPGEMFPPDFTKKNVEEYNDDKVTHVLEKYENE